MDASKKITSHIAYVGGWRGRLMARLRTLIGQAAPELTAEWKWNTPVWAYRGNIVAIGAFKTHVKVNFFKGATLPDPKGLFNAGLEAKASRAIDLGESDRLDEAAFKSLVRAALAANAGGAAPRTAGVPRKGK